MPLKNLVALPRNILKPKVQCGGGVAHMISWLYNEDSRLPMSSNRWKAILCGSNVPIASASNPDTEFFPRPVCSTTCSALLKRCSRYSCSTKAMLMDLHLLGVHWWMAPEIPFTHCPVQIYCTCSAICYVSYNVITNFHGKWIERSAWQQRIYHWCDVYYSEQTNCW